MKKILIVCAVFSFAPSSAFAQPTPPPSPEEMLARDRIMIGQLMVQNGNLELENAKLKAEAADLKKKIGDPKADHKPTSAPAH